MSCMYIEHVAPSLKFNFTDTVKLIWRKQSRLKSLDDDEGFLTFIQFFISCTLTILGL